MAVTTIYLVRHAEAEGNIYRRYQGWVNSNLTENGIKQVAALTERLARVRFDAVYSSPLKRAIQTACAAAHNTVDITVDERLIEVGGGIWEEMPFAEMERDYGYITGRFSDDPDSCAECGESFRMVYERISPALEEVVTEHDGQTVCVVSHGLAIKVMLTRMLYGDMRLKEQVPRILNASVSVIEYENGTFAPKIINSTEHLCDIVTVVPKYDLLYLPAGGEDDLLRAVDCWRDTWKTIHKSENGFSESFALNEMRRMYRNDAGSLRFAYAGDKYAGLVVLDTANLTEDECGHISLLMLTEQFRGNGLGIQLVGEAAHYYRNKGRTMLRLRVDKVNTRAIKFYQSCGFKLAYCDAGGDYIMKKNIAR